MTGNSQNNQFRGNGGNDFFNGGAGSDSASYFNATGAVNATLTDIVDGYGQFYGYSSGADGNDTFSGIENFHGSNFADVLTGNSGENILRGNGGNDFINGAGGRSDDADYSSATGSVQVFLTDVVDGYGQLFGASSGADGNDTLSGIEDIRGSAFNDILFGNSQDNTLRGNKGDDLLNGGASSRVGDWASYNGASGLFRFPSLMLSMVTGSCLVHLRCRWQ